MGLARLFSSKPSRRNGVRRTDVRPGALLNGSYRVQHALAAGGVGRVFAAAHERLPGQVAVKVLHDQFLDDQESVARFRQEAETLAGLRHPHVVQVLDYNVSEGGVPYLVMELLDGIELRQRIGEGKGRSPSWTAGIVRQVANALRAAHLEGIVHRDIKPENIMLLSVQGEPDFVKVVDFGVSNVSRSARSRWLRDDLVVGTPGYMPPEQLRAGDIDDRADQFALAAVAYEMLAGRPPFVAPDQTGLLWKLLHDDPPPLARFVRWSCAEVEAVLRRALAKDREDRFTDILEFADALARALGVVAALSVGGRALSGGSSDTLAVVARPAAMDPTGLDEFRGVGLHYLW